MGNKWSNRYTKRIIPLLFGLTLIFISLVLTGCKKDPRVIFIQGLWYYKDEHLKNIPGETAQETSWEFDNGYFSIYSCCFVEVAYSGYYAVTDRKDNQLILDLFNLRGQNGSETLHKDDSMAITIKIDTQADTILVNGDGPYTRISP